MNRLALVICLLLIGCVPIKPAALNTPAGAITLRWQTGSEMSVAGYQVARSAQPDGPFEVVSPVLAPVDALAGGAYEYVETGLTPGQMYYYELRTIYDDNRVEPTGHVQATAR